MKRKEEIEQKAHELSKIAFPDERNIWARPNFEAQIVSSCCISIAEWADKTMLDKVCEYLKSYRQDTYDGTGYIAGIVNDKTIEDLRKAMEE